MAAGAAFAYLSLLAFAGGVVGYRRVHRDAANKSVPRCGVKGPARPGTKIIGGDDADECEWVWQASLQIMQEGSYKHNCGGVLIAPEWVLTAAHCIIVPDKESYRVVLGEHNLEQESGNEQIARVDEIFVHAGWDSFQGEGNDDIALLRLTEAVEMNNCVGMACMPAADEDAQPGARCAISGWGRMGFSFDGATILQEAMVDIVDHELCREKWACPSNSTIRPDSTNICIDLKGSASASACHGDSGGPVVCETGEGWKVFGVASFVDISPTLTCTTRLQPNAYTRVHAFHDWIQALLQGLPPPPASAPEPEPYPKCTCPRACNIVGACWLPACKRRCPTCN